MGISLTKRPLPTPPGTLKRVRALFAASVVLLLVGSAFTPASLEKHVEAASNEQSETMAARDIKAVLSPKGTLQDDIYYLRGQIAGLYLVYGQLVNTFGSDAERAGFKKAFTNMEATAKKSLDSLDTKEGRRDFINGIAESYKKVAAAIEEPSKKPAPKMKAPAPKPERVRPSTKERAQNEEVSCRGDLQCWGDKHSFGATRSCQRVIEQLAQYDYEWTGRMGVQVQEDGMERPKSWNRDVFRG